MRLEVQLHPEHGMDAAKIVKVEAGVFQQLGPLRLPALPPPGAGTVRERPAQPQRRALETAGAAGTGDRAGAGADRGGGAGAGAHPRRTARRGVRRGPGRGSRRVAGDSSGPNHCRRRAEPWSASSAGCKVGRPKKREGRTCRSSPSRTNAPLTRQGEWQHEDAQKRRPCHRDRRRAVRRRLSGDPYLPGPADSERSRGAARFGAADRGTGDRRGGRPRHRRAVRFRRAVYAVRREAGKA